MKNRARSALSALAIGAIAALLVAERRRPLRQLTMPTAPRMARNLVMGATSMAVVTLVQRPLIARLTKRVVEHRLGIVRTLPLPLWARDLAAFVLLDYSIYVWHILTHRVPVLWRLHRVHHVDRDMDITTALRFHALDMLVSMPWRLAQVRLIGTSPRAHAAWETFFFASVLAHHSNVRLPWRVERRLARLLTTPRLHGIHHNADARDLDANFSSGLSVWDWLHGTARLDRRDDLIVIGVPGDLDLSDNLTTLFALPFAPSHTLKRNSSTSPSATTYSLPSLRSLPASRAPASPPHAT